MRNRAFVSGKLCLVTTAILAVGAWSCSPGSGSRDGSGGNAGDTNEGGGGGTAPSGGVGGSAKKGGAGGNAAGGAGAGTGGATGGNAAGGTAAGGNAAGGSATGGSDVVPEQTAFTFEQGTERWETSSLDRMQKGLTFTTSATRAVQGKQALAVAIDVNAYKPAGFDGISDAGTPDAGAPGAAVPCVWPRCGVYVGVMHPDVAIAPGTVITYRLYIGADVPLASVQPYLMTQDSMAQKWNWFGTWKPGADVARDQWVEIKVTYPQNNEVFWEIGVELAFTASWKGTIYIDNVSW